MKVNFETNINIEVESCNLRTITICFLRALKPIFEQCVGVVLLHYFKHYYFSGKLQEMVGSEIIRMKTTNVRTKFKTIFGDIYVPQIQIRVYDSAGKEHQLSITRVLLGVSPKHQIPDFMKELMGWISSVCTYRIGHSIIGALTNFRCSLTSVWNSAKWYAQKIQLKLSDDGTNEFEADGTGIPTKNSGKRGSELKKVFQKKQNGKLHLVGLSIGKYKDQNDWFSALSELSVALTSGLIKYTKLILSSDGDLSIIEAAKSLGKSIKIQKDKWHIFHQLKYYLWKDGVCKELKNNIIAHFFKITMLTKCSIEKRNYRISRYIFLLESRGYHSAAVYLRSSMEGFYTHETEKNTNVYTTKTERSMRITNQRINVGVWSDRGASDVIKIRLAYYYNGISPLNWKNCS